MSNAHWDSFKEMSSKLREARRAGDQKAVAFLVRQLNTLMQKQGAQAPKPAPCVHFHKSEEPKPTAQEVDLTAAIEAEESAQAYSSLLVADAPGPNQDVEDDFRPRPEPTVQTFSFPLTSAGLAAGRAKCRELCTTGKVVGGLFVVTWKGY